MSGESRAPEQICVVLRCCLDGKNIEMLVRIRARLEPCRTATFSFVILSGE